MAGQLDLESWTRRVLRGVEEMLVLIRDMQLDVSRTKHEKHVTPMKRNFIALLDVKKVRCLPCPPAPCCAPWSQMLTAAVVS
jgi:hypothetical protein